MNRLLVCAVLLAGCQYDYDKLYEHASSDAGSTLTSTKLISKWIGNMPIDQDCIECAEAQCEAENAACSGDAQCLAYTECVGKTPTPTGQAACRAQFSTWVNADDVRARDLNGPYGQCVFRFRCAAQCTDDSELWCVGEYPLSNTSESSIPLSLYLVDAIDQMTPVQGANVRACAAQNPRECSETTVDATGVTDAKGFVKLKLPASFSRSFTGYLEITGSGRYPTLLKFSTAFATDTTQVVSVLGDASFKIALSAGSIKTDDTRGMLQLRMLGCQGAGVKGAFFSLSQPVEGSRTWYIVNALPKLEEVGTAAVGSGGIIDIPEGTVTANAKTSDGKLIGTVDAPVRAKFMTVVIYAPLNET
ncbi:MAG TPA: hypothetical protein VFX59_29205 [Polyangiales bacterium]|nr:hypothetical protein [Polyangiales bacterium]